MHTRINVNNKNEANAIQLAMTDPAIRAFVIVCGLLQALPSDRARKRVLDYAADLVSDPDFGMMKIGKLSPAAEKPHDEPEPDEPTQDHEHNDERWPTFEQVKP